MNDDQNNEVPDKSPTNNDPNNGTSEPSDLEKMQEMFNEHLQPLKNEITQLKEELNKKDSELKKKDDDINNYRKNMIHNMVAEKPIDPLNKFIDEYTQQIEAGLEAAWRNSGYNKRPELKNAWFKAAEDELIRCIRG